jgi:hypothetical protein
MTIASNTVNAISMTVLPDAPVDAVTGLQVPTIAVGTSSGVSVIKHDGTVVNSISAVAATKIAIDSKELFWLTSAGAMEAPNPGSLGAAFATTRTYGTSASPALLGAPTVVAA